MKIKIKKIKKEKKEEEVNFEKKTCKKKKGTEAKKIKHVRKAWSY